MPLIKGSLKKCTKNKCTLQTNNNTQNMPQNEVICIQTSKTDFN